MQSFEIASRPLGRKPKQRLGRMPPYHLFAKFKRCYFIGLFFAAMGVFTSSYDYHWRFSPSRTHFNPIEDPIPDTLRYLTFASSICSMFFIWLKEKSLLDWKKALKTPDFESGKPTFFRRVVFEFLILSVFPYPGIVGTWSIEERYKNIDGDWEWTNCYYTYGETLYILSLLRVYFLYDYFLSTNDYRDGLAIRIQDSFHVKTDNGFVLKSYFSLHPWSTIVLVIFPILAALSAVIMVFERPLYDISKWDFYPYANSSWLIFESMFSLNYGDLVPISHIGRFAAIAAGEGGVILISAIILLMRKRLLLLRSKQRYALMQIREQRTAKTVVLASFLYYIEKLKSGKHDFKTEKLLSDLRNRLKSLKTEKKRWAKAMEDDQTRHRREHQLLDQMKERLEKMLLEIS